MKILFNTLILFILVNVASYFYLDSVLKSNEYSEYVLSDKIKKLKTTYPKLSDENLIKLIQEDYAARINYYSPLLESRPPYMEGKYFNYTKEGYRKSKHQSEYSAKNFNIYLFGGSTTFGTSIRDEDTIASAMNKIFHANKTCDRKISVFNYGTPGHFSTQEFIRLLQLIKNDKKPNIAIFIDGLNDFFRYDDSTMTSHAIKTQMKLLNEKSLPGNYKHLFGEKFTRELFDIPGDLNSNFQYIENNHLKKFMYDFINTLNGLPIVMFSHYLNKKLDKYRETRSFSASFAGTNYIENKDEKSKLVMNRLIKNHANIKAVNDFHKVETLFILQPVQVIDYDLENSVNLTKKEYDRYPHLQFIRFGYEYLRNNNYESNYDYKNFLDLTKIQKDEKRNLYVDPAHYDPYFSNKIANNIIEKMKKSNFINCN